MKTYQEMAEAVFREGDARIAAVKKRKIIIAAGTAAGVALAVGLAVFGGLRHTPETVLPSALSAPDATAAVITATRETTTRADEEITTEPTQQPKTTKNDPAATDSRQPTDRQPPTTEAPQAETPTGGEQNRPQNEMTTANLTTEPGAASYSSEWANDSTYWGCLFTRTPENNGKFWVYYDGRNYRHDPYAGQPQRYGKYLCALADCTTNFGETDGAGIYVLLEDDVPVPVNMAVAIVFPDGCSYIMICAPSQD